MKIKKLTAITVALLSTIIISSSAIGGLAFAWQGGVSTDVQPVLVKNGQVVSIVNENVKELTQMEVYNVEWIKSFYNANSENYRPNPIKLSWTEIADATYDFRLSQDKEFSSVLESYSGLTQTEIILKTPLLAGRTYYWQVKANSSDGEKVSKVFSFTTQGTARTLDIDGVKNTRDIGGYVGDYGTVAQGKVIRGAKLEEITEQGINTISALGIKTDLDLRSSEESNAITQSPAGIENYVAISSPYYAGEGNDNGIHISSKYSAVKQIMEVFAEQSNYPIYLHCSFGKDRTGTIAYLLNGLLGVDKSQLRNEYWISVFSDVLTENGTKNAYDNIEHMFSMLNELEKFISKQTGRTYADKIENYLVGTVGLSEDDIASIKDNLLLSTSNTDDLVNVTINCDGDLEMRVLKQGDSVIIEDYLSNYPEKANYVRKITDKNNVKVADFTVDNGSADIEIFVKYEKIDNLGLAVTEKVDDNQTGENGESTTDEPQGFGGCNSTINAKNALAFIASLLVLVWLKKVKIVKGERR